MNRNFIFTQFLLTVLLAAGISVQAQTTVFTYQGKLTDMSLAANGTYDFQFSLVDESNTLIDTREVLNRKHNLLSSKIINLFIKIVGCLSNYQ